jgi:uncharacterized membrane protein
MQSRLRIAGHGIQPLLLMFPLGLFWMAFVFDLATLLGAPTMLGTVAFWNLVAGLGGGLLATLTAVADAVTAATPATARVFVLALLLDVGVLIVFAVLTLMRVRTPDRAASASLLTVEFAGMTAAAFTAWFSGRFAAPGAPVADRPRRRPTGVPHQPPATIPTTLNQLLTAPPLPRKATPPLPRPGPPHRPASPHRPAPPHRPASPQRPAPPHCPPPPPVAFPAPSADDPSPPPAGNRPRSPAAIFSSSPSAERPPPARCASLARCLPPARCPRPAECLPRQSAGPWQSACLRQNAHS